jgi:metallo-beta-lactamase family protein
LFTVEEAQKALTLFTPAPFGQWIELGREIKFRYHVAGHILGAASVEIVLNDGERKKTILFSGDVGRFGVPLIVDPSEPPEVDYLVCESTYGNRFHPPSDLFFAMASLINEVIERKSVLLMPSFAIGRTQQITYMINVLIRQGVIPPIQVNIDSPMAVKATEIYCKYPGYHSVNTDVLDGDQCVLYGKHVVLHRKRQSSKLLNKLKGPAIILSASGMLTGGRIMHHLMQRLPDPNTTLALVGFMAEGTLGRQISDGEKLVYIHKQPVEVRARVVHQSGLSGHADYLELMHWLEPFKTKPDKVFVTHGELDSSQAMLERLTGERNWDCMVPELDQTVEL